MKNIPVDLSNLPELPEGEWEIVLSSQGQLGDYYLGWEGDWHPWRDYPGDPSWIIARPVLKPLPCRWHKDGKVGKIRYVDDYYVVCEASPDCVRGPFRPTERQAILDWNKMQKE